MPFDAKRFTITGGAVPIVEGLSEVGQSGAAQYAVSREGTLAYWPDRFLASPRFLVWVDRHGQEQPIAAKPRDYQFPRLAPDGTKIAVASRDEEHDIWILDMAKETFQRVTFGRATESYPEWMADSRRVVFQAEDASHIDIFLKPSDGTGRLEPLTTGDTGGAPQSISPDGTRLVYRTRHRPYGLHVLPLNGRDPETPLLVNSTFNQLNASISPDGRWIAYESDESKTFEVYVRPFPAVESGRWMVSQQGGSKPAWARSGRELFFVEEQGQSSRLMAVPVQAGATFAHGRPQAVMDVSPYFMNQSLDREYDVAADGRFVMAKLVANDAAAARHTIVIVSHWFDEVQLRVK